MTDTGRVLAATATTEQWLGVETDTGQSERFAELEHATATVLAASFAGRPPLSVDGRTAASGVVFSDDLPPDVVTYLRSVFDVPGQQAKGAWWLPEGAPVKAGVVNAAAYMLSASRWAMTAAATDDLRIDLRVYPDGFATWALLNPIGEMLCAPLWLRGPLSGKQDAATRDAAWAAVDEAFAKLRLTGAGIEQALAVLRPGRGWSRLSSQQQLNAKRQLVQAMAPAVNADLIRRWRVTVLRPLVERYYAKSKKTPALSKAVLTKAFQPTLAALFGGDWLAFLNYLGEPLAAGDTIATALPDARLYVQASAKVEQVAASKGLPVEHVAAVLASYLGTEGVRSPVERRVSAMREAWAAIDIAHAVQRPGMPPLTGLTTSRQLEVGTGPAPFQHPLSVSLFPAPVLAEVDACWGRELNPRYPDRTVTSLSPIQNMARAFGPALDFWHQLGLTCWFICEGPYALTDLAGLSAKYNPEVAALADAGTPVTTGLFKHLIAAEKQLGRPQDIVHNHASATSAAGITIESYSISGQRRDGYKILRDILTRHRRAWAGQHLEAALQRAWEIPLREVSRQMNRAIAARGKMPTPKQLATMAAPVANSWFGGDLSAMYAALGEPSPLAQKVVHMVPDDRAAFANLVFNLLGGRDVPAVGDEGDQQTWLLLQAVQDAARFVQMRELLDRVPSEKVFPRFLAQQATEQKMNEKFGSNLSGRSPADKLASFSAAIRTAVQQLTGVDIGEPEPAAQADGRQGADATPVPVPAPAQDRSDAHELAQNTAAGADVSRLTAPRPPGTPQPKAGIDYRRPEPMSPPAGWYPSPINGSILQWWDGAAWTERTQPAAPPPAGWYPDAHAPGQLRWWDGTNWTEHHRQA